MNTNIFDVVGQAKAEIGEFSANLPEQGSANVLLFSDLKRGLEAVSGFEPLNKGFTVWKIDITNSYHLFSSRNGGKLEDINSRNSTAQNTFCLQSGTLLSDSSTSRYRRSVSASSARVVPKCSATSARTEERVPTLKKECLGIVM